MTPKTCGPILVVYDTRYGTCAKIASRVAAQIRARGFTLDLEAGPGAHAIFMDDYAAVVIIAAVYNHHHPESIARFVRENAADLSQIPTAFISVSLGAAARVRFARAGIQRIAERLFEASHWRPTRLLYTGGTLDYPIYSRAMRRWMRAAAFVLGLPRDTTRRHELTSWEDVSGVTDEILDELETVRADATFA